MVGSLKIAAALRSIVPPQLLVLAEGVIGPRRDSFLVGAAIALILAVLFDCFAQGRNLAAVPTEASQAGQASTETSSAPTVPPSELRVATVDAAVTTTAPPASATEQRAVPDPLASLDPADQVIAEKIRDLLVAKSGRTFASKKE